MRSILAVALALLPQESAKNRPVPPPVGSGVHVTSHLESELAIRFTADGKVLRNFNRKVDERSDLTIEVVATLAAGLAGDDAQGLETPTAPPPFVRARYGKCPVKVAGPDGSDERWALESETSFFIERAADKLEVHPLYGNAFAGSRRDETLARVLTDADGSVVGPRFAPLVLGRELAAGAKLAVDAEILAPIAAQAVTDGTVVKAELEFRGAQKEGAVDLLAFGVTLVVSWKGGDDQGETATFDLGGELTLVKETAQLFALAVKGPIRYGGTSAENGAKLEISGTGSLAFTYRADPLVAR